VTLAHEVVGEGPPERSVLLCHGILGSRRNWLSFAKRCAAVAPGWRAIACDLRNHGDSHGLEGEDTVDACARDLGGLAAELGHEPRVVVGHSFGGKVALLYARDIAASLRDVWVLDAPPGVRPLDGGDGSVERVFETLGRVPLPIAGRSELIEQLQALGLSLAIARWMTTNIRREPDGFFWKFDLEKAGEMLRSYSETDAWSVLEEPPSGVRVHVLRAERSDRWSAADIARLCALGRAGTIDYVVHERVGHWMHTEDPDGLFAIVAESLRG